VRPIVLVAGGEKLPGVRHLVLAPTGLGHLWTADGRMIRMLRAV